MMTIKQSAAQLAAHAMRFYGILAVIYILLIFLLPVNSKTAGTYNLSGLGYHVLLFAVLLPSLGVWFAAFFSYSRLQEYAHSLARAPEGTDFTRVADGITWLAWSLPVPAIISLVFYTIADAHPGFSSAAVISTNYFNLILPLVGFSIIGIASRSLVTRAKVSFSTTGIRSLVLFFVTAGVLYCYLSFRHLNLSGLGSTNNPYHLPIWLAVLSVIIPYLYTWFVGLLAVYEIAIYSKNVRGLLYQQPLRLLVAGLTAVIISLIALQYMNAVQPPIGHLVLDFRLVMTLLFRVIGGIGFILIALGANRLKKIEEV